MSEPSNQTPYGNGIGRQYCTDEDNNCLVAAHEFGHAMGLPDEYIELPPGPTETKGHAHRTAGRADGACRAGISTDSDQFDNLIHGKGLM